MRKITRTHQPANRAQQVCPSLGDLGGRVRYRRKQLSLTQLELSRLMGWQTAAAITKVEHNYRHMLTLGVVIKLAKALRCSLDYLIFGEKQRSSAFLFEHAMLPASIVRAMKFIPFEHAMQCYILMEQLQMLKDEPDPLEMIDWQRFYLAILPWLKPLNYEAPNQP